MTQTDSQPNDEEWIIDLLNEKTDGEIGTVAAIEIASVVSSRLKEAREEGERSMAKAILRRWGRKDLKFFIELHAADKASLTSQNTKEESNKEMKFIPDISHGDNKGKGFKLTSDEVILPPSAKPTSRPKPGGSDG